MPDHGTPASPLPDHEPGASTEQTFASTSEPIRLDTTVCHRLSVATAAGGADRD
jgi:hypothetical protein